MEGAHCVPALPEESSGNDRCSHVCATGFLTQAVTYAEGRPVIRGKLTGWPADVLRIDAQSTVIDLAPAPEFTRLLNALAPTLIAVEPVQAMAAQLARLLPDVRSVERHR